MPKVHLGITVYNIHHIMLLVFLFSSASARDTQCSDSIILAGLSFSIHSSIIGTSLGEPHISDVVGESTAYDCQIVAVEICRLKVIYITTITKVVSCVSIVGSVLLL